MILLEGWFKEFLTLLGVLWKEKGKLMAHFSGDLCLYADVLSDTRKFPGFEI